MKINKTRGFTLIELLVVISIIGLLSSVIFASLATARLKARDSSIISEIQQLRNLMHLEYSDNGSYTNLQGGWILSAASDCDITRFPATLVSGTPDSKYATKAIEICNKIKANTVASGNRLYMGQVDPITVAPVTPGASFTIIGALPSGSGTDFFCAGHNGRTSRGIIGTPPWLNPGCWGDTSNK